MQYSVGKRNRKVINGGKKAKERKFMEPTKEINWEYQKHTFID